MTIILFAVWSLACVGFGIAATFWVASKLAARDKHAPAPRPAPITADPHAARDANAWAAELESLAEGGIV